jgi:hypothetical protein
MALGRLVGGCAQGVKLRSVSLGSTLRRGAGALLLTGLTLNAQAQQQRASTTIFREDAAATTAARSSELSAALLHSRPFSLNTTTLQAVLTAAPLEGHGAAVELALPLPDGTTGRFAIVEAPVMEAGLAAQFPTIKTYAGVGLDDPTATVRLDLTPRGFHAQVLSATSGTMYIDPVTRTDTQHYLSFFRRDMNRAAVGEVAPCGFRPTASQVAATAQRQANGVAILAQRATGATLRTYRLAVAATAEYTIFQGGTVARAQAAIVTSVNRVVGVYEKELAVRMVLVANNSSLVYTNINTDPYTDDDENALLDENQTNIDAVIGRANYDIGHVFSTGGGGLAGLGVVCDATAKAQGETGSPSPVGDAFDIDYVAHEMGHQFGADHTFNGTGSSCGGGNRNANTAYEPGSGSTIMAYAGICGTANDLQNNSDAYFHVGSYIEIQAYLATTSCGTTSVTGNTSPVVSGPASGKTLPISTPFKLTATGADADNDALTYCWEQFNTGTAGSPTANQAANGTIPLFRSFTPVASPTRYFPRLSNIIANTTTIGERLPTVTRTLKFKVTARDQHVGTVGTIGGVDYSADVNLSVTSTAGPFIVTSPNTALTWTTSSTQTITWNVANTTAAPVSCALVNIRLSTDGGLTYPTVLLANTANDGSEVVTLPATTSTTARIMIEAADNYFFDISNANFSIVAPVVPVITTLNPTSGPVGNVITITGTGFLGTTAVSFNGTAATTFTVVSNTSITVTIPVGATTGNVTVTNPAGTSNGVNFTVTLPVPIVSSLSPTSGPVGTTVTLTGTNLGSASGVTLNGVTVPFTQVSGTSITIVIPAGATTGSVVVTTPLGASAGLTFTVTIPAPVITSLSPTSGLVGTVVTITGTGFTGATGVTFNGTAATTFTVISATSITVTVPVGATTGGVRVLSPNGNSNTVTFTVIPPAPVITLLNPTSAPVGSIVTITGTNFTGATTVSFNGTNAATFNVVNSTTITVTVPVGATTGNVTVTTAGGTSNGLVFTVTLPVPAITRLNPTSGLVGTTVTITGTGFTGATGVTFNGTAATTFTVVSATSITVTVPVGATTGAVTVTTPGGTSNGITFTVTLPAPVITSLSPVSGPVGTVVTITGTGFMGATGMSFNGTATTFTVVSGTSITVTVPTGATTGTLTVLTPNGTSNSVTFTVTITSATLAANATAFAVYPNPASPAQVLHLQLAGPARNATYLIRNVLGQTVAQRRFSGTATDVATTGLAAGTYLLSVQAEGQAPATQRIVLR